ncbi:hypothetical protein BDB00DRAFT_843506 [Zychaea mexicana]|uniref:uncharacterized protein n=1 Tax=Zychaea mexicana TaxID=64656 RepID=UPI0022FDBD95|nr:uncharacterized protein BDB00DRAFT_843506 [Zychaea mexicana]KAI9489374.1 hypothetical protein BDB00DRAFT_843506 [Zychaea mexicana]
MAPGHTSSNEDKRWLIVGAYHTGVPEKTVARISGLSTTAVRQIYLNHQQTGSPSLPKQLSRKVRERPIVEYDEDGNLIDDNEDSAPEDQEEEATKRRRVTPKQSIKITRQPTTKDVIAYVVQQVHQTTIADQWETKSSSTASPSFESPPSLASSPASSSSSTAAAYWRPLTPPREGPHHSTKKSSLSPPLQFPPSPPHQHQQRQQQNQSNDTPQQQHSNHHLHHHRHHHQHTPHLPPVGKFDQTIRGCEIWTRDDDRILIEHMLDPAHGERWRELEAKLKGRHTAKLCSHRWEYLQTYFLKALEGTTPSSSSSSSSSSSNSTSSTTH